MAVALLSACGPVSASSAIADGSAFLAQAEREGAPKYARYEFHKAAAYLDEAKIKNGYGEYEVARRYAHQASELAVEAKKASVRRRDLELRRMKGKLQFKKRFGKGGRTKLGKKRPKTPTAKRPLKAPVRTDRIQLLPPNMRPKKKTPPGGAK